MNIYTIKEAAEILGYKEKTLRNKIYKGELNSIKTPVGLRITEKELEDFTGLKIVDNRLVL